MLAELLGGRVSVLSSSSLELPLELFDKLLSVWHFRGAFNKTAEFLSKNAIFNVLKLKIRRVQSWKVAHLPTLVEWSKEESY